MNVFVSGALSLLKGNGMQEFLASPLVSQDFKDLDISPNPIAGKIVDFIRGYYEAYHKLPTHQFVCDQFQIQIPQDVIGDFGFYAKNLIRRKLIVKWGTELQEIANVYSTINLEQLNEDDVEEKFLKIEQGIQSAIDIKHDLASSGRLKFMRDVIPLVKKKYEDAKNGVSGLPTPWVSLNNAIMGLQENEVMYIGARPGLGKTMMLLLCLKLYLEMKIKVLVVSTEMTESGLITRLASMVGGIPNLGIRKGSLTEGLERAFFATLNRLAESENVKILGSEFESDTATIESAIIEFEPHVVLVDGVYLVKHSMMPKASRVERMPFVTADLKKWGKRYGHRTICTTQMNRQANQSDPETMVMENLSYADSIGQDADFVVGLRATKEMKDDKRIEMRSLKTREGEGFKPLDIAFDFINMQFSEIINGEVVEVSAKKDRRPIPKVEIDDIEDEVPF